MLPSSRTIALLLALLSFVFRTTAVVRADEAPSFGREIQSILAKKCYACHGPDEAQRQADLRLDLRDSAVKQGAIVPGEPAGSELIRRIYSDDPTERMPPDGMHEPLTAAEKQLLRTWIAAGAKYEQHWAFLPPVPPPVPDIARLLDELGLQRPSNTAETEANDSAELLSWPRNSIDRFVLARLLRNGLRPSAAADRYTLARRVFLDLIGLPPTPEEADAFVYDDRPDAYERLVDRLLQSRRYGERWARQWLDLARYADTHGYEKDRPRSIWPYRDWVIDALNADMPFAQFTIEQLAGDMLPGATAAQRIATGFHRNTMLNEEGGIDPLEYRHYAVVDRVATTGIVWLGLTTGCAQCHAHKYDPITHTDYHAFMAYLNNADEPDLRVPDADVLARRRDLERQIAELENRLPEHFPPAAGEESEAERRRKHFQQKFDAWLANARSRAAEWTLLRPVRMTSNLPRLELMEDGSVFSAGDITKRDEFTLLFSLDQLAEPVTALRLEALPDDRLPDGGPGRAYYEGRKGDFFLSEVAARVDGRAVPFASASHTYGKISIGSGNAESRNVIDGESSTGWSTAGREGESSWLVLNLANPLPAAGTLEITLLFERHFAASLGRFRWSAASTAQPVEAQPTPVEIEAILARGPDTWSDADRRELRRYFMQVAPELEAARKEIDALRRGMPALPTTMVFEERPADNPRTTYRYHRGEYLSPREAVSPALPAVLAALLPADRQPTNRLEFAKWLASDSNPLVGRVTVNRAWRAFFGRGLMRTSGDFGTQSDPPTHPLLLDWLACEFIRHDWSLKQLHRLIVTSATYRQSSHVSPPHLRDPENRLLARGPRIRMDAEMIRDGMLRAAGLLSQKMHGPSVYPPQPESVTALAYGNTPWTASAGDDRYRRSLYTFSKRTAPFAAYTVFDAPTGENCVPRRDRSNTPLQALTLLNDELFLEMSRALARLALREAPNSSPERAAFLFRRVLTRPPLREELEYLTSFQAAQYRRLVDGELDPQQIGRDAESTAEFAAWTMLARAVMNLDEAVVKP